MDDIPIFPKDPATERNGKFNKIVNDKKNKAKWEIYIIIDRLIWRSGQYGKLSNSIGLELLTTGANQSHTARLFLATSKWQHTLLIHKNFSLCCFFEIFFSKLIQSHYCNILTTKPYCTCRLKSKTSHIRANCRVDTQLSVLTSRRAPLLAMQQVKTVENRLL